MKLDGLLITEAYELGQAKLDAALENEGLKVELNTQWLASFGVDAVIALIEEYFTNQDIKESIVAAVRILEKEKIQTENDLFTARRWDSVVWVKEYEKSLKSIQTHIIILKGLIA